MDQIQYRHKMSNALIQYKSHPRENVFMALARAQRERSDIFTPRNLTQGKSLR